VLEITLFEFQLFKISAVEVAFLSVTA